MYPFLRPRSGHRDERNGRARREPFRSGFGGKFGGPRAPGAKGRGAARRLRRSREPVVDRVTVRARAETPGDRDTDKARGCEASDREIDRDNHLTSGRRRVVSVVYTRSCTAATDARFRRVPPPYPPPRPRDGSRAPEGDRFRLFVTAIRGYVGRKERVQ